MSTPETERLKGWEFTISFRGRPDILAITGAKNADGNCWMGTCTDEAGEHPIDYMTIPPEMPGWFATFLERLREGKYAECSQHYEQLEVAGA